MALPDQASTSPNARVNERLVARPFEGSDPTQMRKKVENFFHTTGVDRNELPHLLRGAILAVSPCNYRLQRSPDRAEDNELQRSQSPDLDDDGSVFVTPREKSALEQENTEIKWTTFFTRLRAYPLTVYGVIICCSLAAIVQGFDETAVNGAQVFYSGAFNINGTTAQDADGRGEDSDASRKLGLVNAAPHLVSALACLFVNPLNSLFGGRRGVIFATCFISAVSCIGQSLAPSWQKLLIARLVLGLGIGPKSATVPIYASECAPKKMRGALVMMWQMWTAFGIMLGYIFALAFWRVGGDCRLSSNVDLPCSWNWRLMLAAPSIPPLIPILYVFTLPESPRYILQTAIRLRAKIQTEHDGETDLATTADLTEVARCIRRAYESFKRLNMTELQATRELFFIYHSLEEEEKGRNPRWFKTSITELFKRRRSRHALYASVTTMFLQQFCGINVLAYYSTSVLQDTLPGSPGSPQRLNNPKPYIFSLGFGLINFFFALPAIPLMDYWGRRRLLLSTFPFLAVFQFAMAAVPRNSTAGMVASMYLFCVFYSLAEGPIPFTIEVLMPVTKVYSSESFPLHHRDMAMGLVTSVTWIFNFTLALTWPTFLDHFTKVGAFSWYGTWCVIGWFLIYFFVRETKGLGLEEMGDIFNPPLRVYRNFAWEELKWFLYWPFMSKHQRKIQPNPPILQDNKEFKAWEEKESSAKAQEMYKQN